VGKGGEEKEGMARLSQSLLLLLLIPIWRNRGERKKGSLSCAMQFNYVSALYLHFENPRGENKGGGKEEKSTTSETLGLSPRVHF